MKKFLSFIVIAILLAAIYVYKADIVDCALNRIARSQAKSDTYKSEYATDYNFKSVEKTNDFYVSNKSEVYDAIYSIIDNGWKSHNVYCSKEYVDCINDINNLAGDDKYIELINNLVHPYNSFDNIQIKTFSIGIAKVNIIKSYTDEEITKTNELINNIEKSIIKDNMATKDKIKAFHDYIIENTTYDTEESIKLEQNIFEKVKSNNAYYLLTNHLGLCGGYSDVMSIYLHKLGIKNYKISSESHVWNYLILDNIGYHIDVTWDDPVIEGGDEVVDDTFFMLTDEKLFTIEINKHNYDKELYQ